MPWALTSAQWNWVHFDDGALIDTTKEGSIYDSMERLNEIRGWMLKNLTELKKVLNPLLEKIQAEMEG